MSPTETDRTDGGTSHVEETLARRRSRRRLVDIGVVAAVVAVVAAGWFLFIREEEPEGPPAPVLNAIIREPVAGAVDVTPWSSPSAVAVDGERIYVLDTGNNRILSMDRQGAVDNIICETDDCAFLLDGPMDMEYRDGLFYVANTEAGEVDTVDRDGAIHQRYLLPRNGDEPPRATGVYVAPDGTVYASDGTSGRIAIFDSNGTFRQYFGEDTVGVFEFADPTGLTFDDDGNLYIAESSLGMARKISPIGRELATFSMMGGPTLASVATDVDLDDQGFVYLADSKRSVVHVFSRGAGNVGVLGLYDYSRIDTPTITRRPVGLATDGEQVFIMDLELGVVIYTVDTDYYTYR